MTDIQPEPELTETEVFEQKAVRLAKRERLIELGLGAYPVGVSITDTIGAVRARFDNLVAAFVRMRVERLKLTRILSNAATTLIDHSCSLLREENQI